MLAVLHFLMALTRIEAGRAAVIAFTEPIVAVVLGLLLFREVLEPGQWVVRFLSFRGSRSSSARVPSVNLEGSPSAYCVCKCLANALSGTRRNSPTLDVPGRGQGPKQDSTFVHSKTR